VPTPPHTKLLTQAARDILRPRGLIQKGRSRTWLDDRGWWLCVVEFQPSSWTRGSYFNVGAMWLWHERDDIFFALGYRVDEAPFVEFESEEQFAPAARNLAEVAAQKVDDYRALFPDVASAARYLEKEARRRDDPGHALDAGIAWGLAGERRKAERAFDRHDALIAVYLESWQAEDWFREDEAHYRKEAEDDRARSRRFRALLEDPDEFEREVYRIIQRYRALLKLPDLGDATGHSAIR
jgi:hypothetical protein